MLNQQEALTQSVENSDLFRTLETKLRCAVEDAQFSVELRHRDIEDEAPSAYALVSYLRSRGYTVDWNEYTYTITVSWF
jgi:hypothetical protein